MLVVHTACRIHFTGALFFFRFSGELPVLRYETGSETDVLRILEHLRKVVSDLLKII